VSDRLRGKTIPAVSPVESQPFRSDIEVGLAVHPLRPTPYAEALCAQERAHAEVREGAPDQLLLYEHPPTVTLGRATAPAHLLASAEELRARGIELHEVGRGGSVTYHGPGQLVGYPIVDLRRRDLSAHAFVRLLEGALIGTLTEFGVQAYARGGLTGVWTDRGKIAAIGIRVSRGVTLHGFALNVTTDLSPFSLLVPCGLASESVTSMREMGVEAGLDEVAAAGVTALASRLRA